IANDFYQKNEGNLEKSNILSLENLIHKSLYEKNTIAMQAYKKELLLIANLLIQKIDTENKMLNFKNYELGEENQKLINEFKNLQNKLEQVKEELEHIFTLKDDGKDETSTLLRLLAKKLQEKIIDELKYNQNNKKKNDTSRLNTIIETT
ncbi:hypothetical protein IY804_02575, partial [Campylobacter volucris]|nr:hypothetical protein [Campylobacter volucris]